MKKDKEIFVLLGDLGFGIFDQMRSEFPTRCINIGSSEQLMLGMASGMALEGKKVICYSITPFLLYRPFEFIRNYLSNEKIPVKLVGSGRGKDYNEAGFSHHSEEAESILKQLPSIKCYFPINVDEMRNLVEDFINSDEPSFLSLKR
jgi:transketolase